MAEFKDAIPAAGGHIEFLFDPRRGLSTRISGSGFRAMYMVAVSMDGRHLLAEVPAAGLGQVMVYPQPSVLTYMQSDEQGLWGRNCPACQKYFRTNHIMGPTFCPYCSRTESGLAFVTKEQSKYIIAYYDAFMRAYTGGVSTTLSMSDITDQTSAWHYSEEKQQFHFKCETKDCHTETDILGRYGFCPRCGKTNARTLFSGFIDRTLARWTETDKNVTDRYQRGEVWEDMTVKCLSEFEALAKHLRQRLLCFPMTANRVKEVKALNFQRPLQTDEPLRQWFDIGVLRWNGNDTKPPRAIPQDDLQFIRKMIQRRHILMHNGGVVDQDYLDLSGDTQARLGERIRIRSNEAKRFVEAVRELGLNLLDNVEDGFMEA